MNISIKRLVLKWGLTLIQVFSPTISNLFRKRQIFFTAHMISEEFLQTVPALHMEQYCTEINLINHFLSYTYIVSCSLVYLAFLSHLAVENTLFFDVKIATIEFRRL